MPSVVANAWHNFFNSAIVTQFTVMGPYLERNTVL